MLFVHVCARMRILTETDPMFSFRSSALSNVPSAKLLINLLLRLEIASSMFMNLPAYTAVETAMQKYRKANTPLIIMS